MSEVNLFLKVMKSEGYPNPNTQSIAIMVGYDLDNFLYDLKQEIGDEGVLDFCTKAINKLQDEDGLRVDLDGPNGDEYCYIHIKPMFFDEDETVNDVVSTSSWGKSKILSSDMETGEETYKTIQEIIDETDMGGWSELDELLDHIKAKAYNIVFQNCGFGIWWE